MSELFAHGRLAAPISRRNVLAGALAILPATACGNAPDFSRYTYGPLSSDAPSPAQIVAAAKASANNPATIARAKGLFFGTAVSRVPLTTDQRYRALVGAYSNILVHGSALQWHELQNTPGQAYDYGSAELIYAFAKSVGVPMRGHMLLDWTGIAPAIQAALDAATPAQAEKMMTDHVSTIAQHWRGRFLNWNVMNEPISGDVRRWTMFNKMGERYIDSAFAAARAADPATPLTLNQNLIEGTTDFQKKSRDSTLALVQRLRQRGVPVSAVGIEGHLLSSEGVDHAGLDSFIRELAKMDIAFFVSELDINDKAFAGNVGQRDGTSAAMIQDFLDVTLSQPTCQGLNFWGLDDRYNWIVKDMTRIRLDGVPQRPTAFDANYRPKLIWDVTVKALKAAPGPGAYSILPRAAVTASS